MDKDEREAMERETIRILSHSRAILVNKAPYMASTVYGLVPKLHWGLKESVGGPIAVSDKLVMLLDPGWVPNILEGEEFEDGENVTPEDMLAGCVFHECMHILRGMDRLRALPDRSLANIAGDLAINPDIIKVGFRLPSWVYYPNMFGWKDGLLLEQYYELLEKLPKKKLLVIVGGSGGGQGEGKGGIGAGHCGSCAGEDVLPGGAEEEIDKEIGRAEGDVEHIRTKTLQDLKSHMEGPGKGNTPAGFKDLLNFDKKEKTVDWRGQLRQVLRRAAGRIQSGRTDYSLRRPSKRSYVRGILRPGMITREPEIIFVRDTSGSMGREQINDANNEVIQVLRQLGIGEAWLMDADADCYEPKRVRVRDIPNLSITGRGGTSFVPAIEAVQNMKPRPDLCIYLTDGDGDAPATPPKGVEVVWCVVPSQWGRKPAHWGKLVVLSNDQKLREPYL